MIAPARYTVGDLDLKTVFNSSQGGSYGRAHGIDGAGYGTKQDVDHGKGR